MDNTQNQQTNQQAPQGPTKTCKHCKSIIPKGAKVCPVCRKKQGGIVKWIVIAVVIIIIIAAIGSGGNDNDTAVSDSTTTSNAANETPSNDDNSSSANELSESSEIKEGELKFYAGDTWENDFMRVTYVKCGEYTDYDEYLAPSEGKKVIYATFEFENVNNSDQTAMYTDFNCYADGYSCDGYYYADDSAFSQTLSSGRKCTGTVYFEVPEDASEIELEYDVNFWTSENIVFVYSE